MEAARIRDLAASGYIEPTEPVVILGESGSGKAQLATALVRSPTAPFALQLAVAMVPVPASTVTTSPAAFGVARAAGVQAAVAAAGGAGHLADVRQLAEAVGLENVPNAAGRRAGDGGGWGPILYPVGGGGGGVTVGTPSGTGSGALPPCTAPLCSALISPKTSRGQ